MILRSVTAVENPYSSTRYNGNVYGIVAVVYLSLYSPHTDLIIYRLVLRLEV